jgi:hypothetical protein
MLQIILVLRAERNQIWQIEIYRPDGKFTAPLAPLEKITLLTGQRKFLSRAAHARSA